MTKPAKRNVVIPTVRMPNREITSNFLFMDNFPVPRHFGIEGVTPDWMPRVQANQHESKGD